MCSCLHASCGACCLFAGAALLWLSKHRLYVTVTVTVHAGDYATTKLANAIFSQQLLERSKGRIRACSVDPGGVDTGIFRHHSAIAPAARAMGALGMFATPEEGCKAVVHACVAPWPHSAESEAALKAPFYARGMFACPLLSMGGRNGLVEKAVRGVYWGFCGLLDQPFRTLFRGRLGTSMTCPVPPNEEVFDSEKGKALWETSSRLCDLKTDIFTG